jgi:hypothetical protein
MTCVKGWKPVRAETPSAPFTTARPRVRGDAQELHANKKI